MPVILGESIRSSPPAGFPPRKRWTRQEIELFERTEVFEGQHFELIEGDLINKMGKYLPHVLATKRILLVLARVFGWERVLQEAPIDVAPEDHPTSDPEPDVIVLKHDASQIRSKAPASSEVVLAVEVADTTLQFDLSIKAGLYARAGIEEYWVVDLNGRRLIVHREPVAGVYKSVIGYGNEERVKPLAAPGQEIPVADLLGRLLPWSKTD